MVEKGLKLNSTDANRNTMSGNKHNMVTTDASETGLGNTVW